MVHSSSVITDQRYYVVNRKDEIDQVGQTHLAVEDCEHMLQTAPIPKKNLKSHGRRPHLHKDEEGHYAEERIALDPRLRVETSQSAVIHPGGLPKLAAYPACQFDYAHQNSRGKDNRADPGYTRIVTDPRKNQLGLSYHPPESRTRMVRAEVQGVFVADYRRDSLKDEQEKQEYASTGNRSSTWPQQ